LIGRLKLLIPGSGPCYGIGNVVMPEQSTRFPPPWSVEQIPGGYKVLDAKGQSLAYVYGRETRADADTAHVLTLDEARRVASNIAKLPTFLMDQLLND
jgi:hypothetical protein